MSILDAIRIYLPQKWEVKNERNFTSEELNAISENKITQGDYGLSVCLFLKSGGRGYIPLDKDSSASEGSSIDLTKAKLLTLSREGEEDIYRVKI